MDLRAILASLTACHGVSGREYGAAECAKNLLAPYGEVTVTPLGSVMLSRAGNSPDKKEHITLTAHMDEIGMMVREIDDKGFLKIARVGGLDRRGLMGQEVVVLGKEPVYGVVCSVPPHLTSSDDRKKLLDLDEVAIDVGLSKEQAEELIELGDQAVVLAPLKDLQGSLVTGKALDDRAGCASLLWALDQLKDKELSCNVTVIFSVMEEVGGMGALTSHYGGGFTHGIAVDVTFAQSHGDKPQKIKLGSGAAVGISPLLNPAMSKALQACAKAHDIPYTVEVMGGSSTGTDADEILIAGAGVFTGLVSIPQRNMHTPVEIVDLEDVKAVGNLLSAYIEDTWSR